MTMLRQDQYAHSRALPHVKPLAGVNPPAGSLSFIGELTAENLPRRRAGSTDSAVSPPRPPDVLKKTCSSTKATANRGLVPTLAATSGLIRPTLLRAPMAVLYETTSGDTPAARISSSTDSRRSHSPAPAMPCMMELNVNTSGRALSPSTERRISSERPSAISHSPLWAHAFIAVL